MVLLIKAAQLLLSLSILVIFHEFGHFITAKIFKTRVEKFYLFFDPWFSLFKFKKGETEYGVGWLPLGGYVKISGMIDESMDKEAMKLPPQPYEFRSKPAWQRLIIMLGGVTVNILLAIAIYMFTLSLWGQEYLPNSEAKYGITADSLAQEIGLRSGDKIVSLDHKPVEDFFKIHAAIVLDKVKTIQVERDGQLVEVTVPDSFISKLIKNQEAEFIGLRYPFEIGAFAKNSPAQKAGMKEGDKILSLNATLTPFFDQFRDEALKHKNEDVKIAVLRGTDTVQLNVKINELGKIGVASKNPLTYFNTQKHHYNIIQAIPASFKLAYSKTSDYLKSLRLIPKAPDAVGGFITIGKIFPSVWDWEAFWNLTAFLSIMLAILNVLPIPALDGGHVMFLMYEIVTGRKPSDKFMEYAQITGMILLFALLIFANGNDIMKLFHK